MHNGEGRGAHTLHHLSGSFRIGVQHFPGRDELRGAEAGPGHRAAADSSSRGRGRGRCHSQSVQITQKPH